MASYEAGFDDERFQNLVPENLHCSICLNVLRKPMQCERNEHFFCNECITRHLREAERCPNCNERLTLETVRPSRVMRDLVSELIMKCDNSERGCIDGVKLKHLEGHVRRCEFSPVQCSNEGCEMVVNRKDKDGHEMNECDFRFARCRVCGENVNYWERELHCYVTREEMGGMKRDLKETKDEMSTMKEMMMDMRRELSEVARLVVVGKQTKEPKDIIIAGGHSLKSVEMFSWTTRRWTFLSPMTSTRGFSSSFVHEDLMFVCGGEPSGDTMETLKLTEEDGKWVDVEVQLSQKTFAHASIVYNDSLFVFGGQSDVQVVNHVYKVGLVSPYSSRLVSRMQKPRSCHGAQRFADKVVIVGGNTTGARCDSLNSVLLYDITRNRCRNLAPLPFAVCEMATVAWRDNIIIIGGWDKNGNVLNTVVSYNITNERSEMLPSMKQKRGNCVAVIIGNVIVVMGGWNREEHTLKTVECFDFDLYTWKELPSMNEVRECATAVVKCVE